MAVPTNCGCNSSSTLPPSQCKELVSMACVCGLLESLDSKQNKAVIDPSQITLWSPLEYYIAPNKYVTYVNPSSLDPQFQKEIIYRCDKNTVPGESPETNPEKWIAEGSTGYGSIEITDVIGLRSELDNIESSISNIPQEAIDTEILNNATTNSTTYISPRKIWTWWNNLLTTFKITSWGTPSNDTVPSSKLVKDSLETITTTLEDEINLRVSGDDTLTTNLNTEIDARIASDIIISDNLAQEIIDRSNADNLKISLTEKAQALGVATLDSSGTLVWSQVPQALLGSTVYQGFWNASTNSPTIPASSTTNKGQYYIINVAGSTNIDGITDWKLGDWIISNGTSWSKVDNTDSVISVNGHTGIITLTLNDIIAVPIPIASGGTNATSFSTPVRTLCPIIYFDGTSLKTDATIADLGYDTATDIFNVKQILTSGGMTSNSSVFIHKSAISVNSTDGLTIENTSTATSGSNIQMSPRLKFKGAAWDTGSASSKTHNFKIELMPASGAGTSNRLVFANDAGVDSYSEAMSINSNGTVSVNTSPINSNDVVRKSELDNVNTSLNGKEPTITAGTTSQYWRGDKTFQTLDKNAVGLSNVDNTTDLLKPISTATQNALNLKENISNKVTSFSSPTDVQYPSAKLVSDQLNAITLGQAVTVGTGGQYSKPSLAIDAGFYYLIQVGDFTEDAQVTIPSGEQLIFISKDKKYIGTFNNSIFSSSTIAAMFQNVNFIFNCTIANAGFLLLKLIMYNSTIQNISTANNVMISNGSPGNTFHNCLFKFSDKGVYSHFNGQVSCGILNFYECTFEGGGTSCQQVVSGNGQGFVTIRNCYLTGIWSGNSLNFGYSCFNIDGLYNTTSYIIGIYSTNISDTGSGVGCIKNVSGKVTLSGSKISFDNIPSLVATYNKDHSKITNSNILNENPDINSNHLKLNNITIGTLGDNRTMTLSGSNIVMEGCTIYGNLIITGNFNKISNCYIGTTNGGTKTITINSGATKNSILNCTTEATIVNNGTSTDLLINNLF